MKGKFSKILSLMLAAIVAFCMIGISSGSAYATGAKWTLGISTRIWQGNTGWVDVYDANSEDSATITKVTSSNTKVVKVKKIATYDGYTWYELVGKKAGKAKVTVSYTAPDGTTGTKAKIVRVKAYPKHLKSITVNGKKIKLGKNKYNLSRKTGKTSVKIKMALQNGWEISNVYADRTTKSGKMVEAKITKKMLLSGKAIKFSKKYSDMWINVEMTKGNDYINYYFNFYR